jgi:hypothetical protein
MVEISHLINCSRHHIDDVFQIDFELEIERLVGQCESNRERWLDQA